MRRNTSILLISIILLQSGLMLLLCQFQQLKVQYGMQVLLEKKETHFERLILDPETYKKSKINSKEILVDGEMYDVKSLSYSKGKVELLVIHDKHEGKILKRIRSLIANDSQQNSSLPVYVQKLISLYYVSSFSGFCFIDLSVSSILATAEPGSFVSHIPEMSSPPPKS